VAAPRPQRSGSRGIKPWKPLAFLAVVLVALYASMLGSNHTKPKLGIDLAGGTSVTLTAHEPAGSHAGITSDDMSQAINILRLRVDAFGVSTAQISKEGSDNVLIEVPGKDSSSLANQIGQTAALTFRPVIQTSQMAVGGKGFTGSTTNPTVPVTPTPTTTTTPTSTPTGTTKPTGSPSSSSTPTKPKPSGTTSAQPDVLSKALRTASPSATPSTSVPASVQAAYNSINCADPQATAHVNNVADSAYLVTCDAYPTTQNGTQYKAKYILGPSEVSGKDISSVTASPISAGSGSNTYVSSQWQVLLNFNSKGTSDFSKATTALAPTSGQLAVVLDGVVQSAPSIDQGPINGGQAQITGNFTATQAQDLAKVLKYGQLPLVFTQSDVSLISATLGGTQLTGGLIAGAIGLFLVMLYVVFYYRGLSIIAISSLLVSGALTYAIVVLLGPLLSFTLDLSGIAGLIVAIGITADSFVVFFERLRDEVREGRTLRTAVEHGWTRARRTILSADFVSFLAAAVLYMVSVGDVKGFAFTLGLTTLLDVVVVFLFTRPMVTLLARTKYFNSGRPWSGLDPKRLGVKRGPAAGKRVPIVAKRRAAAEGSEVEA
jgi:preprotein translocase subunit SecD